MTRDADDSRQNDADPSALYRRLDTNLSCPGDPPAPTDLSRQFDSNAGGTTGLGDDVRAAVAAALHPVRMPADVATRIRSRLAAEPPAPREATASRPGGSPGSGTPTPAVPERRPPRDADPPAGPADRTRPMRPTAPEPETEPPGRPVRPDRPSALWRPRRGRWARRSGGAGSGGSTAGSGHRAAVPAAGPGRAPTTTAPPAGRRRGRRATVLLTVLAALVAVPVLARPAPGPVPVAGTAPEALWHAAAGADTPAGPAAAPDRVRSCLAAAGDPDPDALLLASRPYPVAGEPGILLVLGTGHAGRHRLVVVAPDCSRVLARTPP